ncbi:hypothetical protein U1Q18_016923 [Sarracenia purpurea var. burkii]
MQNLLQPIDKNIGNSLVKELEKNGDLSDTDPDYSDAIAAQVRRLAMEVRQLTSARQVTFNHIHNNFGISSEYFE